jgi:hypothetical protein
MIRPPDSSPSDPELSCASAGSESHSMPRARMFMEVQPGVFLRKGDSVPPWLTVRVVEKARNVKRLPWWSYITIDPRDL